MDQVTQAALFGSLISRIFEQSAWFKDEKTSPLVKISAVTLAGLVWAIVMALLAPAGIPQTVAGWREVLVDGLLIAGGSQAFHILVNNFVPGLGEWIATLLAQLRITTSQPPKLPEGGVGLNG